MWMIRGIAKGVALVSLAALMTGAVHAEEDFTPWNKRMAVSFNGYMPTGGGLPLTNFPALVILSNTTAGVGFAYSDFQSPPYDDLRFVATDRKTPLDFEVESWNTNGASYVWVRVPELTDTTTIYALWGKADVASPACTTNGAVWIEGYAAVWHMQGTGKQLAESTTNNYVGTLDNSGVGFTDKGMTGGAAEFTSTAQNYPVSGGISCGNISLPGAQTVAMWLKADNLTQRRIPLNKAYGGEGTLNIFQNGSILFFHGVSGKDGDPYESHSTPANTVKAGQWLHIAHVRDVDSPAILRWYVNGKLASSSASAYDLTKNSAASLLIGKGYNYCFNGLIDEVRLSGIAHSADWIWAEYMNMASNDVFNAYGVPEDQGLPSVSNADGATNVTSTSAWINGTLITTGTSATAVCVYWGRTDGGTNVSAWAYTNIWATPQEPGGFTVQAASLSENNFYYYRFCATNSLGENWAPSSESFLAGNVTVTAADPTATRTPFGPSDTGMVTIQRDPAAVSEPLTVYYAWDGTAIPSVDFAPSSATTVTLPAGVASTNITITPLWNLGGSTGDKTAILTLLPGAYAIGAPASAAVVIKDYVYTTGTNSSTNAGNWNDGTVWSLGRRPLPGDDVTVKHTMVLTNATDYLNSFTITNATLTFTNWTTTLTATTVTVEKGATLTHHTCITNTIPHNTNRVHIVCTDLTIDSNGKIDVAAKGHPSALSAPANAQYYGQGLGRGYGSGGGGYGGRGAIGGYGARLTNSGFSYGSSNTPVHVGSGGGAHNGQLGGYGGGAVRIEATGTVNINGTITANGAIRSGQAGAGSGGSIWITCDTLQGSAAGVITARGGNGGTSYYSGHSGGGGRVALYYSDSDTFTGTRDAAAGVTSASAIPTVPAEDGTLLSIYNGTDLLFTVTGSPEEYGNSTPYDYWYRPLSPGTVITNDVEQIVPVDETVRRWNIGWSAATNDIVFASGTTTQAVFTLPAVDTVQTWLWTNQWSLTVTAGVGGTASSEKSGWYTNDVNVEISATATGTFAFAQWSGDLPFEARFSNPLTVTMDQARAIQATFVDTVTQPRTWRGNGMWWESANWEPQGIPNGASPVTIASGDITYDVPFTAASLVISNGATMRMQRWQSVMTVGGDVDVYGKLTHFLCNIDAVTGSIDNTNRVALFCTNLTVHTGGAIDADAVGYRGAIALGNNWHQWGQGPGAGYRSGGGSYGGSGATHTYGGALKPVYGSATDPDMPGSGGGAHNSSDGCNGGGLIRVEASGTVTINGTVSADGESWRGGKTGAGSGGGILIRCNVFSSDNGWISADGGLGLLAGYTTYSGASGGGGRIAIHYNPLAQAAANLVHLPRVRLSARSGWGSSTRGDPGTIWLTDSGFFPGNATTLHGGQLVIGDLASWTPPSLTCATDVVMFPAGCAVTVAGGLTLAGDGGIDVRGPLTVGANATFGGNVYSISRLYSTNGSGVTVGGDCLVANGTTLTVTGDITPGYPQQPGMALDVTGDLTVANASTLALYSHPTNGASPHISAHNVTVAAGGIIDADGKGFAGGPLSGNTWGYGPGGSFRSHGGSYAGAGGIGIDGGTLGPVYGDAKAPLEPGSGGGSSSSALSGSGGGLVRIVVADTVTVDGSITAVGQTLNNKSGAGSGGAIFITCRIFDGSGALNVDGGGNNAVNANYGGSGGGGRIAVARTRHRYTGTVSAAGGIGYNATRSGAEGTVVWIDPPGGTMLLLR